MGSPSWSAYCVWACVFGDVCVVKWQYEDIRLYLTVEQSGFVWGERERESEREREQASESERERIYSTEHLRCPRGQPLY